MKAWAFQDSRQKAKHGDKCPWSVGWLDPEGRRRSKKIGSKSLAEKYRRKKEGELAAGLVTPDASTWGDFRRKYNETVLPPMGAKNRKSTEAALKHFERLIKPGRMSTLTAHAIDRYKSLRARERGLKKGSTVSPATINKELRHIRAVLNIAEEWGMLARAPRVRMLREPERDPEFVDDEKFALLYDACDQMLRPHAANYPPADWWRAILTFAYLTGWRIGEILELRRDNVDFEDGTAFIPAEKTKGRRDARVELHPVALEHLRAVVSFEPLVFSWPHSDRALWTQFAKLKKAAGVEFEGAFHRFRFGFANANCDELPADVLQRLMRHRAPQTTQGYINKAARMRRQGTADRIHVPDVLLRRSGS